MTRHRYKQRDFDFAKLLLTLRKRAGLTQDDLALQVGVTEKAIRNWEGGSNYPADSNLRKLTELYITHSVFTPGQEQDEARALWGQLRKRTSRRIDKFDEQWFASLLAQQHEHRTSSEHVEDEQMHQESDAQDSSRNSRLLRGDWSTALDVSAVYGRTDELTKLEQWLLRDQCRLVAVLGMGGIGKTTLVVKLIQQIASQFEVVLWRSLHNAPALQELLLDWVPILSEHHYTTLPEREEQGLALLVELLQKRRCLLVLDNLETLFQEGELEGRYRRGYEGYATIIRYIAETAHQSCLVLTSRELFTDLGVLTSKQAPVRLLRLEGLTLPASQQLLQGKGLFGEEEIWRQLVKLYAGNPLALKIVVEMVRELFGGDIAAFLAEGFTTFYGIRQLLAQQFERLSELEQALLYWLAIARELIPLEALRNNLLHPLSKSEIIAAMHSLSYRNLVERGERGAVFMLQPVVLEYVTERLIAQVSDEICELRPALLCEHALLQGRAQEYIRNNQIRLIIQPLLDKLMSHFGTQRQVEARLEHLLQQLRAIPSTQQGYGGGNLVNLLVRLNGHVRGKNCSHLTIWQADLEDAEAQGANFSGSDLTGSVFMETINAIASVALSADEQYLASGGINGQIRVWHVADGKPLLALAGHIRFAWALAFHPDNTLLISGGYDGLAKVWNVSSGQCINILQGHTKWVRSVAIHPKGELVATCSVDRSIRLWELSSGRCLKIWSEQSSEVWSVAFSPDGRLLASGNAAGLVTVWNLTNEQELWNTEAHQGAAVPALVFSPDSMLLVSGGEDTTIMVWEASSGKHLNTIHGHTGVVQSVSYNAEGLLASGSHDRTVKLWKIGFQGTDGRCLSTLQGHKGWVWSTVFGPGRLLASGGQDGVVKLWQVNEEGAGVKSLRTLRGYSRLINSVMFSPNGELLVSGEHNGTVRIWETKNGQCVSVLPKQASGSFALAFRPDGKLFAHTSSYNNTIKLWDIATGQYVMNLKGHQGEVWSIVFSPDGRFLLSCSLDTTIKRWEVSSGRRLNTFGGHHSWIWGLAYSSDGRLVASGDVDGIVKVWDIESEQCLHTLQGSPKAIVALVFTPDSTRLLSSNEQDIVTCWDVQSGRCLKTIPGIGDTYWLRSVAFSADSSLLAAENTDWTITIWDVSSGDLLHTFPRHTSKPWSVALSTDKRLLACGMDNGTIQLWERQTGNSLMILQSERPYERMNISEVSGITEAQKTSLKILGAIDEEDTKKLSYISLV